MKIPKDPAAAAARLNKAAKAEVPSTPEREVPATPAATPSPITSEVTENLAGGAPEDKQSSVHARIAQMGTSSKEAIQSQVEHFLANPKVAAVGAGINEVAGTSVNSVAGEVDYWLSQVGELTDGVADVIGMAGAGLDKLADEGRGKLQAAVDDLRARSLGMAAEAERLLSKPEALDETGLKEAQQMWATGKILRAASEQIHGLINLDKAKAFCAKGGSAVFKFTSDVMEVMGEIVHKGAKGAAAAVSLTGRFFKWLTGKDTLRSTALTFYGGFRMNVGSQKFNAGVGGGLYFPSFKEADAAKEEGKSYYDGVAFDWGASACSPVAGGGWNSRGGAGAGVNLYFVSATFNEMTERVFLGVPGVWGVTLGRDKERGSEVNFGNGVGVLGNDKFGGYGVYGVAVHSPLLDPVNKYVTRPIAKCIVGLTNAITGGAKWTYAKVAGPPKPSTTPDDDDGRISGPVGERSGSD